MKSSVETLEGNKVKLSVEVDEEELDRAIDAAVRKLARHVRVPGFRPGKVPRRVLETRIGPGVARQEALRESLPDFYERAVREHDVDPISPPEIDITSGRDEGPLAFDAIVEVMPEIRVTGHEGLRVVLPNIEVTDQEVDAQVERLRDQFAELRPVSRQARTGDHVSIDLLTYRHEEVLRETHDEVYEVGKGSIVPELDDQLRGARAGDILKFNAAAPDHGEVTFQVLVKEVQEKVLPEVTDEWASEASEFETVAELRADIHQRADAIKRLQAALQVRDKVLEALVDLVSEEMPESLVADETERRWEVLAHRLTHQYQGASIEQYLEVTGKTEDDLRAELRADAIGAVKADVALRFVADAEGIEVTDDEVENEIVEMANRARETPYAMRARLEREERLPAVRSGVRKSKALEWLIERTEFVDEDGRVIDRSELTPPEIRGSEEDSPEQPSEEQTELVAPSAGQAEQERTE
ncbi:MAG: trigger factor [Actinomycetota bacterium]|nr:trigger factor [Actinomycetota bacterium]